MKPVFKAYSQGQTTLFPVSLDSKISQDSPVRLVNQIVDNLDISKIIDTYKGGGTSSYPPRVMLKIVIFAYLSNIYSCRKIEDAVKDRITFMWLAGGLEPDHNTVNRFRSKHLKDTINEIFTQTVTMLVEMGYLSLDIAYIDGTKLESRANELTTFENLRQRMLPVAEALEATSLFFFCTFFLIKKYPKIKTAPASLKKLTLEQLNRPNSQLRCSNKDDY
jgi:transposase